jgi:hypothetical protein
MLVAYITTHYDIQPLPSRPLNIFMGEHPIAPEVKVMIRRRVTP